MGSGFSGFKRDEPPKFSAGDRVEAKAKGWKKFYPGKVEAFDGGKRTYTVVFEDGDRQSGIKIYNIKPGPSAGRFQAPDGTKFSTKKEYREFMIKNYYSFIDVKGQHEGLDKKDGEIGGQPFYIKTMEDCTIHLMDVTQQVIIEKVANCKILIGPCSGSIFVRNAKNCTFFIACKQFRCRDCESCTVSLFAKTEPIIETSSKMKFCPYNASYPGQTKHFQQANLDPKNNHWCNVFDFDENNAAIPKPHWELLENKREWPELVYGSENVENPVPSDAKAPVQQHDDEHKIYEQLKNWHEQDSFLSSSKHLMEE